MIELVRQYSAIIEVAIGFSWFGGVSYLASALGKHLVGK